jgi:hypothetical protein
MSVITDEYMNENLRRTKNYSVVLLHYTPERDKPGSDEIVWEHGRRNFELRRDGKICIVGPIRGEPPAPAGLLIFATDDVETKQLMEEDPAVKAGIFTFKVYTMRSFLGDSLT